MKINTTANNWNTTNTSNAITVDDEGMAKMVGLISKNIYSKPASAFREYWLNARESHQATGTTTPMVITLPGSQESFETAHTVTTGNATINFEATTGDMFVIRDFVTGMNRDELKGMITSAGSSSKDNSDEFGGGMGIGSLSGFSVSDQIVFTAFKDGKRNTVILSAENSSWAMADETDTDEDNGVEVSFVVHPDKVADFTDGAYDFLAASGFVDNMIITAPTSLLGFGHVENITDCFNSDAVHTEDMVIRSVNTGYGAFSRNTVVDNIKNGRDNILIRVDGCAYEGIVPTGSQVDVFRKFVAMANKVINPNFSKYTEEYNGEYNFHNMFGYGIARNGGTRASKLVVDVAVGKYSHEIQPSRETIALPARDVEQIENAVASHMLKAGSAGWDILSTFVGFLDRGMVDFNEVLALKHQIEALDSATVKAIEHAGNLLSSVTVSMGNGMTNTVPFAALTGGYTWTVNYYTNTRVMASDVNYAGFVATVHGDNTALWEIENVEPMNKNSKVSLAYVETFDPTRKIVVTTSAKKHNHRELAGKLDIVNDRNVLFNTPVVAKITAEDGFTALFTALENVDGVDTMDFKDWKDKAGFTTKKSTGTGNVKYSVGDRFYNKRTTDEIADMIAADNIDLVAVVNDSNHYGDLVKNYVKVVHSDNTTFLKVRLDGRKSFDKLTERLVNSGVSRDMIVDMSTISEDMLLDKAAATLTNEQKSILRDVEIANAIASNLHVRHRTGVEAEKIAEVFGALDEWNNAKDIVDGGYIAMNALRERVGAMGVFVYLNTGRVHATEKATQIARDNNLVVDNDKLGKINTAFGLVDVDKSIITLGLDKTLDMVKIAAQ